MFKNIRYVKRKSLPIILTSRLSREHNNRAQENIIEPDIAQHIKEKIESGKVGEGEFV